MLTSSVVRSLAAVLALSSLLACRRRVEPASLDPSRVAPLAVLTLPACPTLDLPGSTSITVSTSQNTALVGGTTQQPTLTFVFPASELPQDPVEYVIDRDPSRQQRAEFRIEPVGQAPGTFVNPVEVQFSYASCNWNVPANKVVVALQTDVSPNQLIGGNNYKSARVVRFIAYHFTDFALAMP